MCRLFAQASSRPRGARDVLADSAFSLLRQATLDPRNPQTDGWGLAWFGEDGRPRVEKSAKAADADAARFTNAAEAARSTVVIGHIRAASPGVAVEDAYAHPFEDDGWVFAHNGTLTIWKEVRKALGARAKRLKTDSDSEVYFQQFLKHLGEKGEPSLAFEACVREDWELWKECRERYPDAETPYTSLNAIASNGRGVHALCHASRRGLAECGVCHPGQPWSVMSWSLRGDRFLLASEGVDDGDWAKLSPPETVDALVGPSGVDVRRRSLVLDAAQGPVPEVSRT